MLIIGFSVIANPFSNRLENERILRKKGLWDIPERPPGFPLNLGESFIYGYRSGGLMASFSAHGAAAAAGATSTCQCYRKIRLGQTYQYQEPVSSRIHHVLNRLISWHRGGKSRGYHFEAEFALTPVLIVARCERVQHRLWNFPQWPTSQD